MSRSERMNMSILLIYVYNLVLDIGLMNLPHFIKFLEVGRRPARSNCKAPRGVVWRKLFDKATERKTFLEIDSRTESLPLTTLSLSRSQISHFLIFLIDLHSCKHKFWYPFLFIFFCTCFLLWLYIKWMTFHVFRRTLCFLNWLVYIYLYVTSTPTLIATKAVEITYFIIVGHFLYQTKG